MRCNGGRDPPNGSGTAALDIDLSAVVVLLVAAGARLCPAAILPFAAGIGGGTSRPRSLPPCPAGALIFVARRSRGAPAGPRSCSDVIRATLPLRYPSAVVGSAKVVTHH